MSDGDDPIIGTDIFYHTLGDAALNPSGPSAEDERRLEGAVKVQFFADTGERIAFCRGFRAALAARAPAGEPTSTGEWIERERVRNRDKAFTRALDFAPSVEELLTRWQGNPPETFDYNEAVAAIVAQLNKEGVTAWNGDATWCVAHMLKAQFDRWQRAAGAAPDGRATSEEDLAEAARIIRLYVKAGFRSEEQRVALELLAYRLAGATP